jgi:putative membrane protein
MTAISLGLWAALYFVGTARVWASAGVGRGVRLRDVVYFSSGLIALIGALESPLHELSEHLFVAHMVQHELLMVVAAPLIVLSSPLVATLWALPPSWRRRMSGGALAVVRWPGTAWVFTPGALFCLHALALWIWHLPVLYQAALHSDSIHAVQHLSFFVTAGLFWWTVSRGAYGRRGYGASVIYVFGTAMQSGVLGALLLFSQRLWYPGYSDGAMAFALTALEDQQLAGAVMWIPAGIVLTGAGLAFMAAWLRESARRVARY